MRKVKVGVIQMNSLSSKTQTNLNKALTLAQKASDEGAQLIVFPELFDSGYCIHPQDENFAFSLESLQSPTLKAMLNFAKQTNTILVGCSLEKSQGQIYDTAYILSKDGLIGKYQKIYLWGDETQRFQRGKEYPVFEVDFGSFCLKIGLQICYEIGFPEGSRILAIKGAEIIIFPSAFGKARSYAWNLASRARALENGAFVLASNRSGSEKHPYTKETLYFAGRSKIINPKGEVLYEAKRVNEVLVAELDMDFALKQRATIPYLKDLNLDLTKQHLNPINQL